MISGRFAVRAAASGFRAVAPRRAVVAAPSVIRGYASAADSKPPVALFGLDGTYASALYTAAVKSSALDPVAKALSALNSTFAKDPKLATILASPTLSANDKSQLITELLRVVSSSDATTKNFLQTLAANNRLNLLPGVASKFEELMSASRGEVELTITSAQPLDAKVVKQLETAVGKSKFVGEGKKLKTIAKVSPEIRGGLVVEVGDRTVDLSVSNRIARLNKVLSEAI